MAENEKLIEQRCCELLKARGMTFAAAESCTGGLIAKRITDVPGASLVFMGGVVSYTDTVKHRVLGVPADMLEEYGAVSAPVARAMAEGARKATTADVAVSVTGVAGPDRDERGNAVGTVFVGFSSRKRRSPSASTLAQSPARRSARCPRRRSSSCWRKS
ncbi:MAG: nicotinamide-nucleotide amidohydrolase family protein [Oscillospiraceae bacterium]